MSLNDMADSLADEILTDVAETFFNARVELERMTDIFDSYVRCLREKEGMIADRAGFLNYLLLDEPLANAFYETLGVKSPSVFIEKGFSGTGGTVPEKIPSALTAKGAFTNLILMAYGALQEACDLYVNGSQDRETGESDDACYKVVVTMCDLINKKVHDVSCNMSPQAVLQYAGQFSSETVHKDRIAGAMFGGNTCGLNEKLAYSPIDFESLRLRKYPELPKPDQVASQIRHFCKAHYPGNKNEIRKRISRLKQQIRGMDEG